MPVKKILKKKQENADIGTRKVIGFFGNNPDKYSVDEKHLATFSNFYPVKFILDDITWNSVEQWMMYQKAKLFGDQEIMEKIKNETKPKAIKALGRKVANFDPNIWDQNKKKLVKRGILAKFKQNEDLKKNLIMTGNNILAEASQWDKIWGIGMWKTNKNIQDPKKMERSEFIG